MAPLDSWGHSARNIYLTLTRFPRFATFASEGEGGGGLVVGRRQVGTTLAIGLCGHSFASYDLMVVELR